MKLYASFSEAIREGVKYGPQIQKHMSRGNGLCALGAGARAIGFSASALREGCFVELLQLYPYLNKRAKCPVGCGKGGGVSEFGGLGGMVAHLNDEHLWTREAIADWLQEEEDKLGFVTLTEKEEETSDSKGLHFQTRIGALVG